MLFPLFPVLFFYCGSGRGVSGFSFFLCFVIFPRFRCLRLVGARGVRISVIPFFFLSFVWWFLVDLPPVVFKRIFIDEVLSFPPSLSLGLVSFSPPPRSSPLPVSAFWFFFSDRKEATTVPWLHHSFFPLLFCFGSSSLTF